MHRKTGMIQPKSRVVIRWEPASLPAAKNGMFCTGVQDTAVLVLQHGFLLLKQTQITSTILSSPVSGFEPPAAPSLPSYVFDRRRFGRST